MNRIKVIAETSDYVALNKPAGLLMHALPNKITSEPTVADWLFKNYPETRKVGDNPEIRPGMVHRLDRDTSGILVIARNQEFFERLKNLFQKREIRKTYLALVRGHLERDHNIIRKPLGLKQGTTKRSVHSSKLQKEALTEYRVMERAKRIEEGGPEFKSTLLEVIPKTGRTHQIRVHLTSIGHPIWGDPLYGPKERPVWVTRLMLHSYSLEFDDAGKLATLRSAPDSEFKNVLSEAGVSAKV